MSAASMSAASWDGAFQASLLDAAAEPTVTPLAGRIVRHQLSHGAWVDSCPGWLTGADELYERLRTSVPWRAERRQMYERMVDVPRLLAFYDVDTPRSRTQCSWRRAQNSTPTTPPNSASRS
jgi:hypothetical protein